MIRKIIAGNKEEFEEIEKVSEIFEKEVLLNPVNGSTEYMEFLFRIDSVETFDNPTGEGKITFKTIEVIPPKNERFYLIDTMDESGSSIFQIGDNYMKIRLSNRKEIILRNIFGLIKK